jgi:hypothetical protein
MKQSKKGNQWYFGMKAHVAVDAKTKLIHRVVATSGALHDGKVLPQLLHGKETPVWGDSAYAGPRVAPTGGAIQSAQHTLEHRGCLQRVDDVPGSLVKRFFASGNAAGGLCHPWVGGSATGKQPPAICGRATSSSLSVPVRRSEGIRPQTSPVRSGGV